MKPSRFQVLVGGLVCLTFAVALFAWLIEPTLASVLNGSR